MSATLTQAVKERYETVVASPWPGFWSGLQPEGTALAFPNFVFRHQRERQKDEADGAGGVVRGPVNGRVQMAFFTEGVNETEALVQAEALSATLWAAMEATPLAVGGDARVYLAERDYGWTLLPARGPRGGYVFRADTMYTAMFNP